jgi:glycosyltransferase involved in cell wall biosynthesis
VNALVSVIVPCYNAEAFVGTAVASALAQSGARIEVIAVNDGSRDRTLEVLARLAGPQVRILDQPNAGAAAARNTGLAVAQGEYVQFLDADDLLAPDKVGRQLQRLADIGAGTVASGRWARFTREAGEAEPTPSVLFRDYAPADYVVAYMQSGEMMHPAAWLVPAEVARRAGPWNDRLSLNDDGEYFARVVLASTAVAFVPEALTYYRSGLPGSLSRRRDRAALESLLASNILIHEALRAAEDSSRVQRASADYFQRAAYELYPGAPDLYRLAQDRSNALGGSALLPLMGSRQAWLARAIGWKAAKRVARWLGR